MENNYSVIDPFFYLSDTVLVCLDICLFNGANSGKLLENYSTEEPRLSRFLDCPDLLLWLQFSMNIY